MKTGLSKGSFTRAVIGGERMCAQANQPTRYHRRPDHDDSSQHGKSVR